MDFMKITWVSHTLTYYNRIVNTFTHISGSFLDDVCIRGESAREANMGILYIYFLDYDEIKFKLIKSLLIQLPKTTLGIYYSYPDLRHGSIDL